MINNESRLRNKCCVPKQVPDQELGYDELIIDSGQMGGDGWGGCVWCVCVCVCVCVCGGQNFQRNYSFNSSRLLSVIEFLEIVHTVNFPTNQRTFPTFQLGALFCLESVIQAVQYIPSHITLYTYKSLTYRAVGTGVGVGVGVGGRWVVVGGEGRRDSMHYLG